MRTDCLSDSLGAFNPASAGPPLPPPPPPVSFPWRREEEGRSRRGPFDAPRPQKRWPPASSLATLGLFRPRARIRTMHTQSPAPRCAASTGEAHGDAAIKIEIEAPDTCATVMRPGYYPLEFRWFDVGQQRPNSDHELMRCRDKWSSEHDPEVRFLLPATLATHRLAHCLCLACALRVCVAQCTMHSALRVSREGESTGNAQALATHRPAHCEGAGRTAGQHTSTG